MTFKKPGTVTLIEGRPYIDFEGKRLRETDKALYFRFDQGVLPAKTVWIPYSQVQEGEFHPSELNRKDKIRISQWIAKEKALEIL